MSEAPSEKTQAKAAEYLLAGRIKVQEADLMSFRAHVHSASQGGDPYFVKFYRATGWSCDCPARVLLCSHILACQTITDFSEVKPEPVAFTADSDIDAILGLT